MGITRKTWAAAAVGVLALTLAGCGGDDDGDGGGDAEEFMALSVEEIKEAVLEDMRDADSLRLSGTFAEAGAETTLDIGISESGDCAGSLTSEGGTAQIISGSDGTFLKGDEAFWNVAAPGAADQILAMLGDKWALVPPEQASSLAEFCNLQNFLDELEEDDEEGEASGEKGDTEEIDGREALEIIGEDEETGDPTHVWVAVEEPHYILRVGSDSEDEGGEISFTDFDEPVDTTPPSEDEYVDLSSAG